MRNNKSDFRPEVAHDAEALADNRSDISEKDVAFRLVGEQAHAYDPATEARVVRKCDWFFLPAMGLLWGFQFYDKAILGSAVLFGMTEDLSLRTIDHSTHPPTADTSRLSWATSLFYFGELAGLYPLTFALQRFNIARLLGPFVIIWAAVCMATAGVTTWQGLYVQRFFLGFIESIIPVAAMTIISNYYTQKEQALRQPLWLWAPGAFVVLGGLVNYGFSRIEGDLRPWQYIYLLAGALSLLFGLCCFAAPNSPVSAWFLTLDERFVAVERLRKGQTGVRCQKIKWTQVQEAVLDAKIWLLVLMMTATWTANGALTGFGPLIVSTLGWDSFHSILLQFPLQGSYCGSMLLCGYLSYRYSNIRIMLIALFCLPVIAGCVMIWRSAWTHRAATPLVGFTFIGFFGAVSAQLFGLTTSNVAGATKKSCATSSVWVGFVVGNIVGPQLVRTQTVKRHYPELWLGLIICYCFIIVCAGALYFVLWSANKKKERIEYNEAEKDKLAFQDLTDKENPYFSRLISLSKGLASVQDPPTSKISPHAEDPEPIKLGSKRKASAEDLARPEKKIMTDTMKIDDPGEAMEQLKHGEIDESLYSRQLYVLGHEAMKRMGASNVLIVGLKGLGVEIAKNVALAGVKSLALHDPNPAAISDLSAQFFLHPEDVGKPRDEVTTPRIAELNAYTPITIHKTQSLAADVNQLNKYQVVVLTETSLKDQLAISEYCHQHGIYLVIADTFGLFGYIFTDFGKKFTVGDATGENPINGIIASIDNEGLVSALDETRHGLEDGDFVTFTEIKGMEGLNDAAPRKVTVKGPYTFSIGDVSGLGAYQGGGLFQQVKMPKFIDFESLADQIKKPELTISDFAKFDRPQQLHLGVQALHQFASSHGGKFPRPHNDDDAKEVIGYTISLAKAAEVDVEIDEKLIIELSYQAQGDLSPMAAFFGGLAAQEVLKSVSGKFNPIVQWLYLDSLESLPTTTKRSEELCKPTGTRYDGQIAVFGSEFQEKIANVNEFLVGSGAIGCEMLKNYAMIGLATGTNGKITVTDNDSIEKSNLNRQFLFRNRDVGKPKSECAAQAVVAMNPDLKGKITSLTDRIGPDSEHIFNENFWEQLDGVTNALDNVEARTYVDRRCVFFLKPLLESGTLGTKANSQVILPRLTESYSSSRDPPEQSFPMCTLRSFPNRIEHTIAWARDLFESNFVGPPETCNLYLTQPDFIQKALRQQGNEKQTLDHLKNFLVTDKPLSFDDCIIWARHRFEEQYNNAIQQLLHNFPRDSKTSSGQPFWSGPKRAPTPLKFDNQDPTHMGFIVAGSHLHAFNYGIKAPNVGKDYYAKVMSDMIIPEFRPDSNVKIQANDSDPDPNANTNNMSSDSEEFQKIVETLPEAKTLAGFRLTPVEFEKDDDTNHHIDFITAASNLRALNYEIQVADRHKTKFIAGKIIPAIATTTALVTGLVILELYKIIDEKTDLEQYKNGFINLALPFFGFSEPIASPKGTYKGKHGDVTVDKLWDRFEVDDITLQEFLDWFEEKGLSVSMVSSGVSLLYASFYPKAKNADRLVLSLSNLVETISRKPIPDHQKNIIFEVTAEDQTGEDVEIPYVMVKLRK